MDTLEFLSQDAATRMEYEARMKYLRDEVSRMEGAKSEGRAEGARKKAEDMALELLTLGVEISVIVKASGLSEQEIQSLRSQTGRH
ncbi:hypothetical protein D3C86_1926520 [compost metagenome]